MKILVFLFLVLSQTFISSQADIGDGYLNTCVDDRQHTNTIDMSFNQNHSCDKCVNVSFALPNETMRYFVLINQIFIDTGFSRLYLSKISEVDNPPPIFS